MTRKRYIKLLMAQGVSRNDAQASAREVVVEGISYQQDYDDYMGYAEALIAAGLDYDQAIAAIQRMVDEVLPTFIEAIKTMAAAVSAGVSAFTAAFREIMKT